MRLYAEHLFAESILNVKIKQWFFCCFYRVENLVIFCESTTTFKGVWFALWIVLLIWGLERILGLCFEYLSQTLEVGSTLIREDGLVVMRVMVQNTFPYVLMPFHLLHSKPLWWAYLPLSSFHCSQNIRCILEYGCFCECIDSRWFNFFKPIFFPPSHHHSFVGIQNPEHSHMTIIHVTGLWCSLVSDVFVPSCHSLSWQINEWHGVGMMSQRDWNPG